MSKVVKIQYKSVIKKVLIEEYNKLDFQQFKNIFKRSLQVNNEIQMYYESEGNFHLLSDEKQLIQYLEDEKNKQSKIYLHENHHSDEKSINKFLEIFRSTAEKSGFYDLLKDAVIDEDINLDFKDPNLQQKIINELAKNVSLDSDFQQIKLQKIYSKSVDIQLENHSSDQVIEKSTFNRLSKSGQLLSDELDELEKTVLEFSITRQKIMNSNNTFDLEQSHYQKLKLNQVEMNDELPAPVFFKK